MTRQTISRRTALGSALALLPATLPAATRGPALRIALLGQSLIQQDLCSRPWPGMAAITRELRSADVVFSDLETAISGPLADAPTRGQDSDVLHVAPTAAIDCLERLGINLLATSNNHAWDLGTGGITTALMELDRRRIAHAGSGGDLQQATSAGLRRTRHGAVALVAAAAGAVRDGAAATDRRAGVNELRMDAGALEPADVARCLDAIRAARRAGASVVAYLHNHYWETDRSVTPDWQRRYARACIDAGAALFVAHGPPLLQGIEVYRGAPLLHGLGSFIFQTRKAAGSYGADAWQSACVMASLQDGHCVGARLVPVQLDPTTVAENSGAITLGVPAFATGAEAERILELLQALSARLGYRPRRMGLSLLI